MVYFNGQFKYQIEQKQAKQGVPTMIVGYDGGTGVPQPVGYISVKFQLWLVSSQWWLVISVISNKNTNNISQKLNIHPFKDKYNPETASTGGQRVARLSTH